MDDVGPASPRPNRRPTVAVLVDWLKDLYQSEVLDGLVAAARNRDVNLTVFAGGLLGAPAGEGTYRNFLFELCTARSVDGVVVMAGAIGNHLGSLAVDALARRLSPLPMVSLAVALPGVASVLLDEGPGMRQALEHLVVRHGCRRIAYIRGPSVNAEAERRFALYQSVLEQHGLALDAALVCAGTFHEGAGTAAVAALVDQRRVDFDAVVACNDLMALAAMTALQERGISVPSDVAVLGFDDLEAARFATPALTTVRQPLRQQGATALDLVLAQIDGQPCPAQTVTATELVVRQSCGCISNVGRPGRSGPVTRTATGIDALIAEHGDALRRQMAQALRGADAALAPDWDSQLLQAFHADLRGAGAGVFSATLEGLLAAAVRAGGDIAAWQSVVSTLRRLLLPALTGDPTRWLLAEDLWHEARVSIGTFTEAAQAQQRLQLDALARALAESSATLLGTRDLPALLRALAEQLPRLGIPGAWLALFSDGDRQAARLVLAYDQSAPNGATTSLPSPETPPVAADELVLTAVRALDRRLTLVVEPLFFNARALGFLILELGPGEGLVYGSLAEQMSSALHGALLAQERASTTQRS